MRLSDTHCHLYMEQFDQDLPLVLDRSCQSGIEFIMVPGIDLETSQAAIQLAEKYDFIYAAVGFHPNDVGKWDNSSDKLIRELALHPKVIAIGEIGLDYYRDITDHNLQINIFEQQLKIAFDLDLPVIIHNRQASNDLYPILLNYQKELSMNSKICAQGPGVLHAFNENHPSLKNLIDANFYFGIGGPITFTNSKNVDIWLPSIPLNRLLLETDAPYLTPHPHRGKRNEPAYIQLIAAKVARIVSKEIIDIAEITNCNADKLFSWR